MKVFAAPAAALALFCLVSAASAQNPVSPPQAALALPRIFVEDDMVLPTSVRVVDALGALPRPAVGSRLMLSLPDGAGAPFQDYLAQVARRGIPAWIAVSAPDRADAMPGWQAALRTMFSDHHRAIVMLEVTFGDQPESMRQFALQVASTEARARGTTLVAVGGLDESATARLVRSLNAEIAPYI
ncbi:MAG: hypothetical protein H0T71_11690, partial [Acidobacteria bacterium]|nr:hypothetical protein [Acidobacteriota bacterium]